jgi:hypothetical protein
MVIALGWVTTLAALGLPITEFAWHLPFALLGALVPLAMYKLGAALQSRRAGLIAGFLVAVLPLHAAFSRTSGESHFILATLLQIIAITLFWAYLKTRTNALAWLTGSSLALAMLTDFGYPGLLVVLLWSTVVYRTQQGMSIRLVDFKHLLQWRLILPLVPALAVHIYGFWAQSGIVGRVTSTGGAWKATVGGLFAEDALTNLNYVTNWLAVLVFGLALVWFLASKRYTSVLSISVVWATLYSAPFIFLIQRPRLQGHFIPIAVALLLLVALEIDLISRSAKLLRWSAYTLAGLLAVSMLTSAISMVYGVATPMGLFQRDREHGSVEIDVGVKAAAWWIRGNTQASSIVFADLLAGPTVDTGQFYFERAVVGTGWTPETDEARVARLVELFNQHRSSINVAILGPTLERMLNEGGGLAGFGRRVVVVANGEQKLVIYERGRQDGQVEVIDSAVANSLYDRQYASLGQIVSLPFREMRLAQQTLSSE